VYDTLTANECLQQSDAKRGGTDYIDQSKIIPEKTSLALTRAKAMLAEHNMTSKTTSNASPSKADGDWASFAYALGKLLHGSYSSN